MSIRCHTRSRQRWLISVSLSLMDALSAVVELVKALAWPISVFAIILLLRKAIQGLIASIHEGRVKYKDLEFTFKRDLAQAQQSIKMLPEQRVPALTAPAEPDITELMELAQLSPRVAVIEASRTRLEAAATEFAQKHAPPDAPKQRRPFLMFLDMLMRDDAIPPSVLTAIRNCRHQEPHCAHA